MSASDTSLAVETAVLEQEGLCGPVLAMLPAGSHASLDLEKRDLKWRIHQAQDFAREWLGVDFNLFDEFEIPTLPWPDAIPVFDPSGHGVIELVETCLKFQGMDVWPGITDRSPDGFKSLNHPTLCFIQDSKMPSFGTFDTPLRLDRKSPKTYLGMRGYIIACGLYYHMTREYLDQDTFTAFPDDELPGNRLPTGQYLNGEVSLRWIAPGTIHPMGGMREVIQARPKKQYATFTP